MFLSPSIARAQISVALTPTPAQQFFSQAGAPLASGCIYTYISGTSTPLATYTDGTGTAQLPNPIILDAGGFKTIFLSNSSYRFSIWSYGSGAVGANCGNGVFQRTVDAVSAYTIINTPQNLFLLGASSDPGGSAGELAYRTDIPCFRGFTTLWDCFVTLTATQTLTNKTLVAPIIQNAAGATLTNPNINGTVITGPPATYLVMTNNVTTGTTLNKLTKIDPSGLAGFAIIASAGDTGGVTGITVAGAGNTGNATIQQSGSASCVFDNAVTAGDYVQISTSVAGDCHDSGATYPASGQIIGRLLATNGAPGTYILDLFGPELRPSIQGLMQSGAYSNATTTFSDVTGIGFTSVPFTHYTMSCNIYFQGSLTTAGPKFQFTGPVAPSFMQLGVDGATNATAYGNTFVSGFSVANTILGTLGAAGANFVAHVNLGLATSANGGVVQMQAAANGAGTMTIFAGSSCNVQVTN